MMLYNDEEIRVIPVRKSLTRPQLICGCDRVLFLLLMLFCIALIFPGGLGSLTSATPLRNISLMTTRTSLPPLLRGNVSPMTGARSRKAT